MLNKKLLLVIVLGASIGKLSSGIYYSDATPVGAPIYVAGSDGRGSFLSLQGAINHIQRNMMDGSYCVQSRLVDPQDGTPKRQQFYIYAANINSSNINAKAPVSTPIYVMAGTKRASQLWNIYGRNKQYFTTKKEADDLCQRKIANREYCVVQETPCTPNNSPSGFMYTLHKARLQ